MSLDTIIAHHPRRGLRFEFPTESSEATVLATTNFERNRAAIERVWARTVIALPESLPELEWLFARDGALSARHVDRRWFNDISVPKQSAARMLKQLSIVGTTAVLLAPTHAAQVRRVLDLTAPNHAIIVVIPGESNAGVIIACDDFSADIAAGRLWLAVGPDWNDELKAILEGNEGLSPPQTMIRVPGLNAAVVEIISRPCDSTLAGHVKTHRQLISMIHSKPRPVQSEIKKACVVTTPFALWDDAGLLLAAMAAEASIETVVLDAASPTQASDLRLARTAETCDIIIAANVGRSNRPGVVPDATPWVTWVTKAAVPARVPSAAEDLLVIADDGLRAAASASGWPDSKVIVAREPRNDLPAHERVAHATIVCDLLAIAVPKSVEEMSSLRLVWEAIERELIGNALRGRPAVDEFILRNADRVGVPREGFPLALFRERLVQPIFMRELALELAAAGGEFEIYGDGWRDLPTLQSRCRGPVRTAEAWSRCLDATGALFDVWPGSATHPARRVGIPLIAAWGRSMKDVAATIRSPQTKTPPNGPAFGFERVIEALSARGTGF